MVDYDLQWDFSSERSDQGDLFEPPLYLKLHVSVSSLQKLDPVQNAVEETDFTKAEQKRLFMCRDGFLMGPCNLAEIGCTLCHWGCVPSQGIKSPWDVHVIPSGC